MPNPFNKPWVAYEPTLIPPLALMQEEGIDVLEEWFRWAEEWSLLLRIYGQIQSDSHVLEIGCGLGRIAFPLRYILSSDGSYDGFDICGNKIQFLHQNFTPVYPHFRFQLADIANTFYNPSGKIAPSSYSFPYTENSFDIIFASSVFTHTLPDVTENYFKESARVLKPNGRCLFSFFLLDYYKPQQPRPLGFARPVFNFDHSYQDYGTDFAIADVSNPETMTAYRLNMIETFAQKAGLILEQEPIQGLWSGTPKNWVGSQDLLIFKHLS
ncbi:class I SAM-dependent methyltransferase [Crocosphaera sp. UHCC 0190]|uniref:class I SAM-dependent methyltransferase n=1 Tax=Crocosphaera sp. UHCC 0190 TaxID=3110246 RepID=UPI002B1E94E9|nr:class I SAM-dependent methyltransferase [Crocosphaera sp. UHCC 0190]MEA5511025.1 class I SAM-dependent methyltransferase [Crocosphaera sp. UHCC 0190]